MQIGIDSYSYHRLLGEVRPGEQEPTVRFARGSLDVLDEGRQLGVDLVALETCFLPAPDRAMARAYAAAASGFDLALSWGHPNGLVFGTSADALGDLLSWIGAARELGCRLVRLVLASPLIERPERALDLSARALKIAAEAAQAVGVELALENHADVTAAEVDSLLSAVGDPALGACLDTANASRVGDDPLAAARCLASRTRLVHLKDIAAEGSDPIGGPRSVPFGEGDLPLQEILLTLHAAGFDGPVCVELGHLGSGAVDERALVAQGIGWLRSALDDASCERISPVRSCPPDARVCSLGHEFGPTQGRVEVRRGG